MKKIDVRKEVPLDKKNEIGFLFLHEIVVGFFWSVYREDNDLEDFKQKSIETRVFTKQSINDLFSLITEKVKDFRELRNTTKKDDDEWIEKEMEDVVSTFMSLYYDQFEKMFNDTTS